MFQIFSRKLYLRIWLAVVGGVAVLTLAVGWAWHVAEQHKAREHAREMAQQMAQQNMTVAREITITDAQGKIVLHGPFERVRRRSGEAALLRIRADDGRVYQVEMTSPPFRGGAATGVRPGGAPPGGGSAWAFWLRPPFGFLWLLALVGVAVALGVFPIIRRLLKRLENLQRSVQRFGEGELSVRVSEQGRDEVADLARQFNAAAARIEALVQSHKTLLANASHELRSPLTRIRMGLELLPDVPEGDTVRQQRLHAATGEIRRNIAELDQLVDEILLASRLEAPGVDMGSSELVDLVGLAAEECARVDAELDIRLGSDEHGPDAQNAAIEVQGVPKLLRRAVRNLLENARRYSQGEVSLALHVQPAVAMSAHAGARDGMAAAPLPRMAVITVQDGGPGVPEAQRERIFEKFYRLPGASERSGGVGLGLALVRSIAQRHGGSVRCTQRSDGQSGACFVLCLPMPQAGAGAAGRARGAAQQPL